VIAVFDLDQADHPTVPLSGLDVDHAFAAAALDAVLGFLSPLAVPILGNRQDRAALLHHVRPHYLVAGLEGDPLHSIGGAAHRAHFALREANAHPVCRGKEDVLAAVGDLHRHQAVAILDP